MTENPIVERSENPDIPVALNSKIDTCRRFENFSIFFRIDYSFLEKPQFLRKLRKKTISLAFHANLATCKDFKKLQDFFGKTHIFSGKTQFLNVLRSLLHQSYSTAKLLLLRRFKNIQKFFQIFFSFFEKTHFLNALTIFTISVALYHKLATVDNKNIKFFLDKPICVHNTKLKLERIELSDSSSQTLRKICYFNDS